MVRVSLLDFHEVNPSCATANDKETVEHACEVHVEAVLADVLLLDLAQRHAVVAQERAQREQDHHSPETEDSAADRALQRRKPVAHAARRAGAATLVLLVTHVFLLFCFVLFVCLFVVVFCEIKKNDLFKNI